MRGRFAPVAAAGPVAGHPVPVLAALRAGSGAPSGATRRLAPTRLVTSGGVLLLVTALAACGGSSGGGVKVVDVASASTRATTADSATAGTGAEYRLADGTSAVFPGTPAESKLPIAMPDGTTLDATLVQSKKGEAVFLLTSATLPAKRMASATPSQILVDSQAGAIQNSKGTLVSEKEVTVAGNPGRDFVAKVESNGTPGRYRSRVVLVGDKQIQLVYVAGEGDYTEADGDAFLTSLKIGK